MPQNVALSTRVCMCMCVWVCVCVSVPAYERLMKCVRNRVRNSRSNWQTYQSLHTHRNKTALGFFLFLFFFFGNLIFSNFHCFCSCLHFMMAMPITTDANIFWTERNYWNAVQIFHISCIHIHTYTPTHIQCIYRLVSISFHTPGWGRGKWKICKWNCYSMSEGRVHILYVVISFSCG